MPDIVLDIPSNSRFHSSLNEIDIAMKSILLHQIRIADPRNKSREQNNIAKEENEFLWDKSRVFFVDDLTTEEIFDTYLLRKNVNNQKDVDISYPILAYTQEDIESVFWGTGNRDAQWEFEIPYSPKDLKIGQEIIIKTFDKYRGMSGTIADIKQENDIFLFSVSKNGRILSTDPFEPANSKTTIWFTEDQIKPINDGNTSIFKGKAITGKYSAVILADNRDEIQYIRDKLMLRVWDAKIWWKYASPTILNNENQIFTVFDIPNIEKYPKSAEKLKDHGYIYGTAFNINIWACITDEPLPTALIETIRMNLTVKNDGRTNRIIIN